MLRAPKNEIDTRCEEQKAADLAAVAKRLEENAKAATERAKAFQARLAAEKAAK